MRRTTRIVAAVALGTALSCPAFAATDEVPGPLKHWTEEQWSAAERRLANFKLYNECEPVPTRAGFAVERSPGIDLSEAMLWAAVEHRLRAAGVFTDTPGEGRPLPFLLVDVEVMGPAYYIFIEFAKWMHDFRSNDRGWVTAWRRLRVGLHDDRNDFIVSELLVVLNDFLTEYLRVNESACAKVER